MAFIVLWVAAIWLLAYFRANLLTWTASCAFLLAVCIFTGDIFTDIGWLLAWLFVAVAAIVNVPGMRRFLITGPLFRMFRKRLPPLSRTEREALEAGTVWWDGELFTGSPGWSKLLAMPKPKLNDDERLFLDGPVEELCRVLDDWNIAAKLHDLPPEVWRFIKEKGFWGMIIPKEYGGLGFSALAHSEVIMKIASRSVAAAVTVMVPNSLGPAELLIRYGTKKQKEYYLPRLARGEEIPCFALTGPDAGSDAASIQDSGIVCSGVFHGEEIIGIRLNWEKRYITLGPIATVLGLAFRLRDPEHLLGNDEEPGITLALIPTSAPGISIGSRHDPLGIPFQNGPNSGKDVFIPLDWIIGGQAGAGHGWRMLMESLAAGRSISLPALSSGGIKFVARVVGAYARVRRQFRMPIGRFEGVEEALARIAGNVYLMDAARGTTVGAVDSGERPSVISAILKYHFTEQMRAAVNDGMDVLGGKGICLGPRNPLGCIYLAAPIGITVEGANILTRSMIIFGQGVIRCHPYLLKEMQTVANPDDRQGLTEFDRLFRNHAAFVLSNAARSLFLAITRGHLVRVPSGPARRYYRAAMRFSAAFALTADAAMLLLGGALKRRERISARLADILSHLYIISAILKQFKDREWPTDEMTLVQWGCEDSIRKIEGSFVEIFSNLPVRPATWLLRHLILPFGRSPSGPKDRLVSQVAQILMEPSPLRDRLTAGLFIPIDPSDPLSLLEDALRKADAAEPVELKLRQAVKDGRIEGQAEEAVLAAGIRAGIITCEEGNLVRQATTARTEVIQVDHFPSL
jgi:acyl-CoA dehydrogenase